MSFRNSSNNDKREDCGWRCQWSESNNTKKNDAAVAQINNKLESVYFFTKNSIITVNKSSNLKIRTITLTFQTAHFDMICEELLIKKRILWNSFQRSLYCYKESSTTFAIKITEKWTVNGVINIRERIMNIDKCKWLMGWYQCFLCFTHTSRLFNISHNWFRWIGWWRFY